MDDLITDEEAAALNELTIRVLDKCERDEQGMYLLDEERVKDLEEGAHKILCPNGRGLQDFAMDLLSRRASEREAEEAAKATTPTTRPARAETTSNNETAGGKSRREDEMEPPWFAVESVMNGIESNPQSGVTKKDKEMLEAWARVELRARLREAATPETKTRPGTSGPGRDLFNRQRS